MTATTRPVLVVCGLAAEARIAAGTGVLTLAAPPPTLAAKLEAVAVDVSAVVSFGLAGGLADDLPAGTLVLSTAILAEEREWRCDPAAVERIRRTLEAAGLRIALGKTICRDAPVLTADEKAVFRSVTGAVAVDTESHLAAAYAERHGKPFIALRAVCDTARNDLPPLAVRAIGKAGRLDWQAIGEELVRRPEQLAALPGTALATLRAMNALRGVRRRLRPRFGF